MNCKAVPELLAPAGNLERLKVALAYGADAVYISGKRFGLRAFADNFETEEIQEAVDYSHEKGKKIYVTMNIFPHNEDFKGMEGYIEFLNKLGVDAIILSDPGILSLVRENAPDMDIHLSTQANCTNWKSALFWRSQGVKRIILARELSLKEISEIRKHVPEDLELEIFVHGAMCISYSGRCALSNYLAGRDANRGLCAHPCRWKYQLVEEKRPGEYMPVLEDERGSYIFNSKDLCMLEYIPEIVETGVNSIKIEGRMKTSYYVATVVQTYRKAIDKYAVNPESYSFDTGLLEELKKTSHRPFTTGFYFGKPGSYAHEYSSSSYIKNYDFVGIVLGYDEGEGLALVEQRNPFSVGDEIEIMQPGGEYISYRVRELMDQDKNQIKKAPHPQQKLYLPVGKPLKPYSILRKARE